VLGARSLKCCGPLGSSPSCLSGLQRSDPIGGGPCLRGPCNQQCSYPIGGGPLRLIPPPGSYRRGPERRECALPSTADSFDSLFGLQGSSSGARGLPSLLVDCSSGALRRVRRCPLCLLLSGRVPVGGAASIEAARARGRDTVEQVDPVGQFCQ